MVEKFLYETLGFLDFKFPRKFSNAEFNILMTEPSTWKPLFGYSFVTLEFSSIIGVICLSQANYEGYTTRIANFTTIH